MGRSTTQLDVPFTVAVCLLLGTVAQVAILAKAGGLSAVTNNLATQKTLQAGFVLFFFANFSIVGVLIWAAWRRPATRREWLGFALVILEICAFNALTGSRHRVIVLVFFIVIVAHYVWRPWRLREVVAVAVVAVLFSTALLGVRQATYDNSFTQSLRSAPDYITDPRGLANDMTEFDALFYVTNSVGRELHSRSHGELHHKYGGWIVRAVRSYVPGFVDPGRPESGDIEFRKDVWELDGAGRPLTLPGDLFYDFGWAGIAVGALLFGILARSALGLVSRRDAEGWPYRVALYAVALFVLFEMVRGTHSITINFLVTLALPFLLAVHVIGRLRVEGGGYALPGRRTAA